MSDAGPEHAGGPTPAPPSTPPPLFAPGERLPWLLRPPKRDTDTRPHDREADRAAALGARRTAMLVVPAIGLGWLLVAIFAGEDALRIVTVAAVIGCVTVGARAAITAQRFRRHWLEPDAVPPPPIWVTLVTVASAVFGMVAVANLIADLSSDRPALRALVITSVLFAIVGVGAFAHVSGGRTVGAALRNDHVY